VTSLTLPLSAAELALNAPQQSAVVHKDGPLLVLAGAGTGKTRVVTMRMARLLRGGEHPKSILAVTFTNKAALEMKHRLLQLAGVRARGVWVSTFHALCARLLRRDGHRIGLSPSFAILDESDQRAQLLHVARALSLTLSDKEPRVLLQRIGTLKNLGLRSGDVVPVTNDPITATAARIYPYYLSHCRSLQAVDFDDLLLLCRELLEKTDDVRRRYQSLFRFLHVDEFQDTNPLQLDIIRLLCGAHDNLCVVGDDDQAIYAFRGANVDNILQFDQQFASSARQCTVVTLEENYRSTAAILACANHVIEKNTKRRAKKLFTSGAAGEPVHVVQVADGDAEAESVGDRIAGWLKAAEVKPDDVAVLYRSAPQSRSIEEALRVRGVPYRVVGGMSFFERRDVKDVLAYIACIAGDAELAFRRAISTPSRGIGEKTVARIVAAAAQNPAGLLSHCASGDVQLPPERIARLTSMARPLIAFRTRWPALLKNDDADIAGELQTCLRTAGFGERIAAADLEEQQQLQDTLDEVIDAFAAFVDRYRAAREAPDLDESIVILAEVNDGNLLQTFLDKMSLREDDKDDDPDKHKNKVTLMSLHASKGLEYERVCLIGCEEGFLPHRRALEEGPHGVEEERRLAYVGVTRARKLLRRHEWIARTPSRFILDFPSTAVADAQPDDTSNPAAAFFAQMKGLAVQPGE
jgi:DNA helicase II / ATP-dependent DNA helicase PcrA